jgi:chromosome segregation ATPase
MAEMNFAEAGKILRKQRDLFQAASMLHEACDKALQAEQFLGELDSKVKSKEAELAQVQSTIKQALEKGNADLSKLALQFEDERAKLEMSHRDQLMSYSRQEADLESKIAGLRAQLKEEQAQHAVSVSDMSYELGNMVLKRDAIQVQYDELKSKMAELVKPFSG